MSRKLNNREAVNRAFEDMKPEIMRKREIRNSNYDFDNWVVGVSHVYTKESRRLNRELKIEE